VPALRARSFRSNRRSMPRRRPSRRKCPAARRAIPAAGC